VAGKLKELAIKHAQPKDKTYRLYDGGGLYLEVRPNAGRYWFLKYRALDKEKRASLGPYPRVSLAQARIDAEVERCKVREGVDLLAERKAKKAARRISAETTFEAIAREWHANQSDWTEKHRSQVIESLEVDVFPAIGERPIAELTSPEVLACLKVIEGRGALEIARRVRQRCSAVFRFAIASGRANSDPASTLSDALKVPDVQHMAAIAPNELPELLRKIRAYDGSLQTRLALELLSLTFVRTVELRGAKWEEIDLECDSPRWVIPAERMKMRREHIVPLSQQAKAVLQQLKVLNENRDHVLPGERNPRQPISENTVLYALYRLGYHSRMTGHGFRAVASTVLNECGWRPDVIEKQLAHEQKSKVRAAYNRAQYLEERGAMMQAWADMLDVMRETGEAKVVPFKRVA
jgi:integrase